MSAPPEVVEEVRPSGVDPRIRVFHAGEEVDTFVVLTRRFAVFIDTMSTPALMRQVIERVRPDLQGRPVLVVNTHADWDHVYGNQLFAAGGELPGLIVGSSGTAGGCWARPPRSVWRPSRPRTGGSARSGWSRPRWSSRRGSPWTAVT